MSTLTIGQREFAVEKIEDGDRGMPLYMLTGKRGAEYGTSRVLRRDESGKYRPTSCMFVLNASRRVIGIPSGFQNVRLTDEGGELRVV